MSARRAAPRTDGMANLGVGVAVMVPIDLIRLNTWNPNVQPDWIYDKELASITKFGFVDPLIVREVNLHDYQIIDGEHRLRAAKELGYAELPCWNLGLVDDADARELTVVLNETRGEPDQVKLRELLADLIQRRGSEEPVRAIMPFGRERFDEIMGRMSVDWDALEQRRKSIDQDDRRWKEIVFRMPYDAAKVVEDAINKVQEDEGLEHSWQALEMICADAQA